MSDHLTIENAEILSIGGNDLLHVSDLNIAGAVVGSGSLETYCERLVKTGVLADTVSLICLAENLLIPNFHLVEEIFQNDPDLLFLIPVALEVPAVWKKHFN